MYGKVEKCKEQIEIDTEFIQEMDKLYPNRKDAAIDKIKTGWNYFYNNDYDTSMKRFNQAWLLNPNLYEIYWGYGNLIAIKGNPKEAIKYFDIAKKYNPENSDFYVASALAYSDVFLKGNNTENELLKKAIKDLESGLKIDPKNAKLYSMLSTTYFYLNNIKKAKEYLKKAESLDASTINNEYRKILESK